MILRKTKVALLLPVAVWLLTGCVKLNVDLVVNRDGPSDEEGAAGSQLSR